MKKLRLRVSYSTRAVSHKVLGRKPTSNSSDTSGGVKKLSDKGKDRVPCKTKR
jgi:hypothetical protein